MPKAQLAAKLAITSPGATPPAAGPLPAGTGR
jgi:hypothetical protein